ncbi:L,D-transpeptidase [Pedobacter frigidisoli]|uniref:L,D-transpeptidase n=1 Tax=Pedobacter frigidisoli TaxID=2530455 RepID=A0A4R0P5Z5_9SPHI|nr:L,D-transpeptidase family protein [Pedobacter frigidisoli]TCD10820.1 L,D-transpeptidase [Pedobacter frigidisoli]
MEIYRVMNSKNSSRPLASWLLLITLFLVVTQGCKKSRSDIAAAIFKETGNKVFKDVDAEVFAEKLKVAIAADKSLRNPKFMEAFYAAHDYSPILVMKFLADSGLRNAAIQISQVGEHGLSPTMFKSNKLSDLVAKVYNKASIKTVDDAYSTLIALEISACSSITDYTNAMRFGVMSPRKIYAQYYTATKRPDSVSFGKVFETSNLDSFLDSIQPKAPPYKTLQAALKENVAAPGMSVEETNRILLVNLERLRWQNQPTEEKYVWVNIPDFSLQVIDAGKVALTMKVCVGEGRNNNAATSLVEYDEGELKKDRPFNRETPQLKSEIHSVQVNPIWNIPESIATNEITKYAAKDRYYLANKNIDVFYKGKLVDDPETIDWSAADVGKTYSFKQRPGDDNSLGKIKFLFNNECSVYLHDTPAQDAFNLPVRAVSHGCVRLEKPLELAEILFGKGTKTEKIKAEMASDQPKAEDIGLSPKVPLYLSYYTCWRDSGTGKLRFAKDIYGLDAVLYTHLNSLN